nr:MAG TPA: hypothetical protein [Caudoviricetes sp.]
MLKTVHFMHKLVRVIPQNEAQEIQLQIILQPDFAVFEGMLNLTKIEKRLIKITY